MLPGRIPPRQNLTGEDSSARQGDRNKLRLIQANASQTKTNPSRKPVATRKQPNKFTATNSRHTKPKPAKRTNKQIPTYNDDDDNDEPKQDFTKLMDDLHVSD
ncbi:structure-specific endonuclease subunit SLX1 [Puccinia sorghi]|uniref:Structure-specific endonuclease subunit SLX1 n=1 Tax=Puccinia sorghi TaxID=27349 RepID=A0A0L6UCM9_9BASI|nr:structure-specific endonuclease subunit SLX1 [Puccinia sorghi]